MALTFHILAHKNPSQLSRALEAIWAPENIYVIHYDRRRPQLEHEAVRALAEKHSNVVIQPPRPVLWGRFSLLRAQVEGLKIALARNNSWTHWINLSGQCFPLQPVEKMASILADELNISSINAYDPLTTTHWPDAQQRFANKAIDSSWLEWWLWRPGLGRRLFGGGPIPVCRRRKPKPPAPFARWYGGDNWVVLARATAEYVTSPACMPILDWFADTLVPDESFFQTAVLNSPTLLPRKGDHRRELLWHAGDVSPSIYRVEHFDRLETAAKNGRLFARKFDLGVDAKIFDAIEQRILHKV